MIAARPTLTRVQVDLLSRLSFRWPDPCYLVVSVGGRRALVVTEMSPDRSLARVCAYNLATVNAVVKARWVELGEPQRVPDFSGRKRDSDFGWRVRITSGGCRQIRVPTIEQRLGRQVTDAQRAAAQMVGPRRDDPR